MIVDKQIKKITDGSYFGNEEGFGMQIKEFTARVSSTKCSILKIAKQKIKQNIFYEQHLLRDLESESNLKKNQSMIEKLTLKHQLKRQARRMDHLNKQIKADDLLVKFKGKLGDTNVLHSLKQQSLTELGQKGLLPAFTQKFQTFNKQNVQRKNEITNELLDSCISHSITSEMDKVRMRKRQQQLHRSANDSAVVVNSNRSLNAAAQTLVDDCHRLMKIGTSAKAGEMTHNELSISSFFRQPGANGSSRSVHAEKAYYIKQGGLKDILRSVGKTSRKEQELSCSSSYMSNGALKTMAGKYKLNQNIGKKRDIDSIKATELFPKIKHLFQDSVSLLTKSPRHQQKNMVSERSLLMLPFSKQN